MQIKYLLQITSIDFFFAINGSSFVVMIFVCIDFDSSDYSGMTGKLFPSEIPDLIKTCYLSCKARWKKTSWNGYFVQESIGSLEQPLFSNKTHKQLEKSDDHIDVFCNILAALLQ